MTATVGGTLRGIKGYAFQSVPGGGTVVNIHGYAFELVEPLPTPIGGKTALLGFISINSAITWTSDNSVLGPPIADSSVGSVNTRVQLTAMHSSGYSGSTTIRYGRHELAAAFSSKTVTALSPKADTTVYGLLNEINSAFGYQLTTSDLVDGPVLAGATSLTLTTATGSYMFLPGTQAEVTLVTG